MADLDSIPGLEGLWAKTSGDPRVRVAVLDGPVDQSHPSLRNAELERLPGPVQEDGAKAASPGPMTAHGTHVASILFGRHDGPVPGVAPGCRGLLIPVFSDDGARKLTQLDLARGIDRAFDVGAHVINISGGQLTQIGESDDLLARAVRRCAEHNVLLVAAAGNDGCECLHVPAALPSVLAVGAMDDEGRPFDYSNWGEAYRAQGVLAPGENILGAQPGGGTVRRSGTSLATPIVSGVAALLLSLQLREGREIDPRAVRAAILEGADPCDPKEVSDCGRFLVGRLDIPGAEKALLSKGEQEMPEVTENLESSGPERSVCGCRAGETGEPSAGAPADVVAAGAGAPASVCAVGPAVPANRRVPMSVSSVTASDESVTASQGAGLAYVLGILGYDFGTEARRDSFKQLMPPVMVKVGNKNVPVPANPYDARQMVSYLKAEPSEARSLIWTLNLDLTPVYAIEPDGPYGADVYSEFVQLLAGQVEAEGSSKYVERVSVPGVLTGGAVRLFSGQVVPVLAPENTRGLYGWHVNSLIDAALTAAEKAWKNLPEDQRPAAFDEAQARAHLRNFLNRLYYDLRNLGTTSPERAMNYAATNVFQSVETFAEALANGKVLDEVGIEKSPFCRLDSDCWDVKLKFFDPENTRRARSIFRFTVDVSDKIPVTLGKVVTWTQST